MSGEKCRCDEKTGVNKTRRLRLLGGSAVRRSDRRADSRSELAVKRLHEKSLLQFPLQPAFRVLVLARQQVRRRSTQAVKRVVNLFTSHLSGSAPPEGSAGDRPDRGRSKGRRFNSTRWDLAKLRRAFPGISRRAEAILISLEARLWMKCTAAVSAFSFSLFRDGVTRHQNVITTYGWKSLSVGLTACFTGILRNHNGVTDDLVSERAQAAAATQMSVQN